MGLDATVYLRGHGPDDDDCADHQAAHRRLANIALAGHLRERVGGRLARNSLLLAEVLYSGAHAGGELPVEFIPAMMEELAALADDDDPQVRAFVQAMADLAEAAVQQSNPICF